MNTHPIHLGRAPLSTSILSSIDPLSAGLVGGAGECEREDTLTASVRPRHRGAGAGRDGGGEDGVGAHLLTQGAADAGVAVKSGHLARSAGGGRSLAGTGAELTNGLFVSQ